MIINKCDTIISLSSPMLTATIILIYTDVQVSKVTSQTGEKTCMAIGGIQTMVMRCEFVPKTL